LRHLRGPGTISWCVDFRGLNQGSIVDSHPLPNIKDNLFRLSRSCVYSTLDGAGAYHLVPIKKQDREKTAFGTPWGSYQFRRTPFGLCNAPATYCRLVQMVLQGIPYSMALPYLDDTCVHSRNLAEHFTALQTVLEAFRKAGLKLQPKKCFLFKSKVEYLGHMVSKEGIGPHARNQGTGPHFPRKMRILPTLCRALLPARPTPSGPHWRSLKRRLHLWC
jgi:hypothetical protein